MTPDTAATLLNTFGTGLIFGAGAMVVGTKLHFLAKWPLGVLMIFLGRSAMMIANGLPS